MTDQQRTLFETSVVERMKESGFLEIEIRTECLVRCGDDYQDEVVNSGWYYWRTATALATPQPIVSQWRPMSTAPTDGTHCILAIREGAFIYAVQGAFSGRQWNVVHRDDVQPLCWMPNIRLPAEFLPAGFGTTSSYNSVDPQKIQREEKYDGID